MSGIDTEAIAEFFGFTPWISARVHFCHARILKRCGRRYEPCDHVGCSLGHGQHLTDRVVRAALADSLFVRERRFIPYRLLRSWSTLVFS